ncbi:integrase [Lentzea sp. NPDC102401]|uniref:integrase n=1 Tax=Lentzea sp. NPDC102401 TaxID=3364128 RepID=UPI003801E5F9
MRKTTYSVKLWATRKYEGKRTTTWWVRWQVDGQEFQEPFKRAGLAKSFRNGLEAAANKGEAFYVDNGRPVSMDRDESKVSFFDFACIYMKMKWPDLAGNSRRSTARSLTDAVLALIKTKRGKPSDEEIRTACAWAFNMLRHESEQPDAQVLATVKWLGMNTYLVTELADKDLTRAVLRRFGTTQNGKKAADSTVQRRRGPFVNLIEYAIEKTPLSVNPVKELKIKTGRSVKELDTAIVANPQQAHRLLSAAEKQGKSGAMLQAAYACQYYAALRTAEVIDLKEANINFPSLIFNLLTNENEPRIGEWGSLKFQVSNPAVGKQWTDGGERRERRQLKGRRVGEERNPPVAPELAWFLWRHIQQHGVLPDGRLFRGVETADEVPEGTYARAWRQARIEALSPEERDSVLAGRPYDLRHACVSTWLEAGVPPVQVAKWAGQSVEVLFRVYAKVLSGRESTYHRRISSVLSGSDLR